jgi:hypothetical protein
MYPIQEVKMIYDGSPSERRIWITILIAQRILKKYELKRWNKVRKRYKTKKPQFRYISE